MDTVQAFLDNLPQVATLTLIVVSMAHAFLFGAPARSGGNFTINE